MIKPNEPTVELIYRELDKLMSELDRDLTIEELTASLLISNDGVRKKEEVELAEILLNELRETPIAEDAIYSLLATIQRRDAAFKLAVAAMDVAEGKRSHDCLPEYVESVLCDSSAGKEDEEQFVDFNLKEIYESKLHTVGLRWRLQCLNRSLGSLRRGNFGFIFARPESGKTTFLASECGYMAQQAVSHLLWFNNEQEGSEVALRCYQAVLGLTTQELVKDLDGNQAKFLELTKGNLRIVDSASIHRTQVERICKATQPSLIIFDQLDKIKGFDGDREDLRLGAIYQWARELAKTYCPVIGVTQADGTGEGKKYLTMDNVSSAKTSKQAEADWILGIGKTHDSGLEYVRYLNISKNKLSGDEDSDPNLRHGKFEVIIEPEIARYVDV